VSLSELVDSRTASAFFQHFRHIQSKKSQYNGKITLSIIGRCPITAENFSMITFMERKSVQNLHILTTA